MFWHIVNREMKFFRFSFCPDMPPNATNDIPLGFVLANSRSVTPQFSEIQIIALSNLASFPSGISAMRCAVGVTFVEE